ncbi:hypothetical protein [Microbispora siamensis]|uniref:MarR family transcriptional regulator n=1 Tax=Microbispora siamensis TaxID=564413 RepID=A0ABQ4H0D3_9ACTN|nr:hypothetical protein [Microbispora siamensis]GIH67164.1 hypothetical protein Msi02_79810 [Microbispora siamensis]
MERAAVFCIGEYAVPPIAGRVLAWLMICDPPEQSAGQIAEAIGASRASVAGLAAFRDMTAAGMEPAGSDPARTGRLRAAHNVFDWMD